MRSYDYENNYVNYNSKGFDFSRKPLIEEHESNVQNKIYECQHENVTEKVQKAMAVAGLMNNNTEHEDTIEF